MDLNKDIKDINVKDVFKKKFKLPNKKSMNLYQVDNGSETKRIYMIFMVGLLVVVALYAYFVVFDRINQINELTLLNTNLDSSIVEIQARTSKYNELKEEYYRYSESYISDEEQLVDRIAIMTLLNESTKELGTVVSTDISNNLVNIKILTDDLDKVRQFKKVLEENTMVENVVVYSASRSTGEVVSTVAFDCVVTEE